MDKKDCCYCGSCHLHQQCPAYGKMCSSYSKPYHFKALCMSNNGRKGKMNDIEQENNDNQTDMVNINSTRFNGKQSIIVGN